MNAVRLVAGFGLDGRHLLVRSYIGRYLTYGVLSPGSWSAISVHGREQGRSKAALINHVSEAARVAREQAQSKPEQARADRERWPSWSTIPKESIPVSIL